MGLDAGVYKNLRSVSDDLRKQVCIVDAETGEIDYEDDVRLPGYDRKDLYAMRIRIGSIPSVAELREDVENRLPGKSLLLDAVLYSGSHCDDFISLDQLDEMEREVKLVEAHQKPLPSYLQEFLNQMSTLIATARKEQNPIVFV
jgi:hypothetical protein